METNASKSSFEGPLKHLGESCPVADRALAALTIALMCNEGTIPEDTDTVGSIHHGLFSALKEEDRDLKVNALLAVSALANLSLAFVAATSTDNIRQLMDTIPGTSKPQESKMITNALGCLAAYARVEDNSLRYLAESLKKNHALETAHGFAAHESSTLRTSAVETLCALVSNTTTDFKMHAIEAGLTPSLMDAVAKYATAVDHIQANVLSLLCIGMLINSDPQGQKCIAASGTSIACLLGYMRQQNDADLQALSSDIFAIISKSNKDEVTQSLRTAQELLAKSMKYTTK